MITRYNHTFKAIILIAVLSFFVSSAHAGTPKSDRITLEAGVKNEISIGDTINLLMAAAAFNFKKWMRATAMEFFVLLFASFLGARYEPYCGKGFVKLPESIF